MTDEQSGESEERYRQLIETSPIPINLFDASAEIVWANDAVLELLAVDTREELVGRSIFDFIHPTDQYTAEQELLTVVEEKESTGPTEMTLHRADGETRQVRVSTAPGRYDGEDIGQAVVVDTTPLLELQADLEEERQFIENALDTLPDVFYVVDTEGNLERWNDSLPELSGYTEREVSDMAVEDFFVEDDVDRVSESIRTALKEGEGVVEARVVTKKGRKIPYEFRKRRLHRDGDVSGVVGIGRDISDRKARDQHIRAVDRLLQHTLRNQLNVVRGTIQSLRDDAKSTSQSALDRIDNAAERLLSIFEDHHHIVGLLTGDEVPSTFDAVPVVEKVVAMQREQHPEARITIDSASEAHVSAVPHLERALQELIENGVIHNDNPEPVVHVTVEVMAPTVSIQIEDNGPPIPEMERDVVTGKVQTGPTYHSEGLGLWFVHWVVERSGGKLSFDDAEPGGNVVTVELPSPYSEWG